MVSSDGEVLFVLGIQESKLIELFEDFIMEGFINVRLDFILRVDGEQIYL